MLDNIVYRDAHKLPPDCPPHDAKRPSGQTFYRFVESSLDKDDPVAVAKAFLAWEDEDGGQMARNRCKGRAVSLYNSETKAEQKLDRLRGLNPGEWEGHRICSVTLTREAGAILRSKKGSPGHREGHYDWWPALSFEIADHFGCPDHGRSEQ